jgi:AraC-like DNA-binding protein
MNAQNLFDKSLTLSRVAEISRTHGCHKGPRTVSFSCDWAQGNGVAFEPFNGVQFGICGPLTVTKDKMSFLRCESPVLVCIVVVSGETQIKFAGEEGEAVSISSSMFALGELSDVDIALRLPKQKDYMHVALFMSKKFLESIFGQGAYTNIKKVLQGMKDSCGAPTLAAGIASAECMKCVKCFIENHGCLTGNDLYAKYSILEFFFKAVRSAEKQKKSIPASFMDDEIQKIQQLKSEIEQCFLMIENAGELYSKVGMNRSKINQGFKHLYGVSVAKFVHKCKMEYAYSMLKERKMNVSQCAFAVGYSNVGHFISAYKKLYGITPKQTMRQMQELTN